MIPSGSCAGPPFPICWHVYMLTCPLVKPAHLIGRLTVRLDLHHGFSFGRRMAERGAIRDMQRAGVQPIALHELRRLVIHARRGRASRREDHESGLAAHRSEEHTSELQSLMRISYAVICLIK